MRMQRARITFMQLDNQWNKYRQRTCRTLHMQRHSGQSKRRFVGGGTILSCGIVREEIPLHYLI